MLILKLFLALDFNCGLFVLGICSKFYLTIGMVPLFAHVTFYPGLTVDLTIISSGEINLEAVVAFFILFKTAEAILTEADQLVSNRKLHLLKFSLLSRN